MNRKELKEEAKRMIVGNKLYLWKPMIIISLLVSLTSTIVTTIFGQDSTTAAVIVAILGIVESVFMFGYAKYVLDFVRGKKEMEWKDVITYSLNHFGLFFLVGLLVSLNVTIGSMLLVIPGIIAGIGLTFYQQVAADNDSLGVMDVLKKAWEITNGHKIDIFVLMLSFIGWFLLVPFTLCLLMIWLMPYVTVTLALAYEQLRK